MAESFAASASMIESNPLVQIPADTKSFELNSNYVINPCKVTCVLSPVLKDNVSLTVTNPNGEIVSDISGLRLENVDAFNVYNIKLSTSGQYRLVYHATAIGSGAKGEKVLDTADNLKPSQIVLNVDDTILPIIRFTSYETVHLKLLEVHKVRDYSVSDNLSTGLALKVRIMITDDHFNVVDNGYDVEKYGFTKEGKYSPIQEALGQKYSFERSEYVSDEEFSNFRALSGGSLKQNFFYRGASPVDNSHKRAGITDSLSLFLKEKNHERGINKRFRRKVLHAGVCTS